MTHSIEDNLAGARSHDGDYIAVMIIVTIKGDAFILLLLLLMKIII